VGASLLPEVALEVVVSKKCETCGSTKFGLIRHRWLGYVFCSKACKDNFFAKRSRQIEHTRRWLGHSLARQRS
jgi:hypothetical protein